MSNANRMIVGTILTGMYLNNYIPVIFVFSRYHTCKCLWLDNIIKVSKLVQTVAGLHKDLAPASVLADILSYITPYFALIIS